MHACVYIFLVFCVFSVIVIPRLSPYQESRIQVVRGLCTELTSEKYHDAPAIESRYNITQRLRLLCLHNTVGKYIPSCTVLALLLTSYILVQIEAHDVCCTCRQELIERKWTDLLAAVEACKSTLSRYHDLMSVFSEMNDCLTTMSQIEVYIFAIMKAFI